MLRRYKPEQLAASLVHCQQRQSKDKEKSMKMMSSDKVCLIKLHPMARKLHEQVAWQQAKTDVFAGDRLCTQKGVQAVILQTDPAHCSFLFCVTVQQGYLLPCIKKNRIKVIKVRRYYFKTSH